MQKILSERTDPAAEATKELIFEMFSNIQKLKGIRKEIRKKHKSDLLKLEIEFQAELDSIEREIYQIENTVRNLYGGSEFRRFRQAFTQVNELVLDTEKEKDLNTIDNNKTNKENL
jgi:hypothetical protein